MGIKQAIYTSCRIGIEGKSGVCLYSMSEALNVASKNRFMTDSIYKKDYKCQLPAGELPLNFFTGTDETGALYIQQVRSIIDYDESKGRTGNVLSQMLLLERPDELALPAMAYYESPDFRTSMREEEVSSGDRPAYLPELSELRPGVRTQFEQVCEFIKKGTGRMEAFLHLLAAVPGAREEKKTIVIADSPENIVMWMAGVTFCLPMELNRKLTLSTYAFDPESSGFDLCGYVAGVSGSEFLKSRHDYSLVFDMENMNYPRQDISGSYFNNAKMSLLTSNDEYVRRFNDFLDSRRFSGTQDERYLAFEVYSLLDGSQISDDGKYSLSRICDFGKQWFGPGEICTFTENLLEQFSERKKAQADDIRQMVSVMANCPVKEMTACLLAAEKDREEKRISGKLLDYVWDEYLSLLYGYDQANLALLEALLKENPERSAQLLNFEMKHTKKDGMDRFRDNLHRTLNPETGRWSADSEKVLEKYEDFIQENYEGKERLGKQLELLRFLLELRKNSQQIQRVVANTERDFPIADPEISEKNKLFKKGRDREYVSVLGSYKGNLFAMADAILDYTKGTGAAVDCSRSHLYLAGVDLWRQYLQSETFDFARSANLLKTEFAESPIDTGTVSAGELKSYFQWIRTPLLATIFTRESYDLLFTACRMTAEQKQMAAGLLMDWMLENYDKNTSTEEIGQFILFCYSGDPEIYRGVLEEKIGGMKKTTLQGIRDYFGQNQMDQKSFGLYLDSICENKQKKGTKLHELFERAAGGFRKRNL